MSVMSLRLPDELNTKLRLIAEVLDQTISDVVRDAVSAYCSRRLEDPKFVAEVQEHIKAMSKLIGDGPT